MLYVSQGALRVGVKEPDDDQEEYEYYYTLLWYHPDCLKNCMEAVFKMKNVKSESFCGFKSLRPADKKKLREMCGETAEADEAGATGTNKGKGFVVAL